MKIIINADDFGKDITSTREIISLIKEGAISSTTIMANGSCLDACKKTADVHPEISFGAHLCLSEFASITKNPILCRYGITDECGNFIRLAILKKWYIPKELSQALEDELCAQMDLLLSYGFKISHVDSHQHVHLHYRYTKIFGNVLKKYGIRKVRRNKPIIWRFSLKSVLSNIRTLLVNNYYKRYFSTTDAFMNYFAFTDGVSSNKDVETVELMCHPGHTNPKYQSETVRVKKKDIINNGTHILISYNEL